jgi:hypothetical protein
MFLVLVRQTAHCFEKEPLLNDLIGPIGPWNRDIENLGQLGVLPHYINDCCRRCSIFVLRCILIDLGNSGQKSRISTENVFWTVEKLRRSDV